MYKWTFEQQTVLGENTGLADVEMSNRVSKSRKYQICKIPSKFGDFNKKNSKIRMDNRLSKGPGTP